MADISNKEEFKMSKRVHMTLGGLIAATAIGVTPAHAAKVNDNLSLNGLVYANVISQSGAATSTADDQASGFHFDRAYFEARYMTTPDDMIRLTLDQKAPDGQVFVKYAYWQHVWNEGVAMKVGQNHTPLVDYQETNLWRHRYVQKTYTDYWGAETSSDLGVSVFGKAGGSFDYYVSLMNGEGYTKTPNGAGYALEGRAEYHTNGLHVGLYGHSESTHGGTDGYDPTREVLYGWWENDMFQVGGNYMMADDGDYADTVAGAAAGAFKSGKGYNILANVKLPMGKKTMLFVRYDTIDKRDTGTDQTLTIAGMEFEAAPGVMLAPNVQSQDDRTDTITSIGIHGQYKF
jgi:hypothetical protein